MKKERGYKKELMILPFDHRSSFAKKLFGFGDHLTPAEVQEVASYKTIIYDGFVKTVNKGLPKDKIGILVDEQYGTEVIKKAKQDGTILCVAAEKSGQDEFDFEYGSDYGKHIEAVNPDFVKVLVRYNPEDDRALNHRQAVRLTELSQYLDRTNRKYIFELLVPATDEQLQKCKGDKAIYDVEMRPRLMVKAIEELQNAGVEADIWKLEGLDREKDYQLVAQACRRENRNHVGIIVLGRGENEAKVKTWLEAGANVPGVIGFAVGRTVFWEPLKHYREKKWTREQTVDGISERYHTFCKLWLEARDK